MLPFIVLALLTGCAGGPKIDHRYASVSQDSRVRHVILHYTEADFPHALEMLTKNSVSSHYLIADHPGAIYQLIDESRRAYRAGVSAWKNDALLIDLLKQIVARHQIEPDHILGHNEIAPQRKPDPGPMFPWQRLAQAGLIRWPDANMVTHWQHAFEQQLPDNAWFQ